MAVPKEKETLGTRIEDSDRTNRESPLQFEPITSSYILQLPSLNNFSLGDRSLRRNPPPLQNR